jgi:hypothetical protein
LKCDSTHAETRFRRSAKRASPFKSEGASVQSTTGSRGVRIIGSNAGYTMLRGSVKGTGYPLHSSVCSSLPLSCVTSSPVRHRVPSHFFYLLWRFLSPTESAGCGLASSGQCCYPFDSTNNPLKMKCRPLYLKTQSVPRSKHFISVIKTNQFML